MDLSSECFITLGLYSLDFKIECTLVQDILASSTSDQSPATLVLPTRWCVNRENEVPSLNLEPLTFDFLFRALPTNQPHHCRKNGCRVNVPVQYQAA